MIRSYVAQRGKCPYSEFFWSTFSRIRLNTERYSVSLRIQSERGKNTYQENSEYEPFQAVVTSFKKLVNVNESVFWKNFDQ